MRRRLRHPLLMLRLWKSRGFDILIAHAAPFEIGGLAGVEDGLDVGSPELTAALESRKIRYVFCGHIHQGNHKRVKWRGMTLYNVSRCNNMKEVAYPLLTLEIPSN